MDLRSYFKTLSSKEQPSHSSCEEGNVPQARGFVALALEMLDPARNWKELVVIRGSTKKGGRRNLLGWSRC